MGSQGDHESLGGLTEKSAEQQGPRFFPLGRMLAIGALVLLVISALCWCIYDLSPVFLRSARARKFKEIAHPGAMQMDVEAQLSKSGFTLFYPKPEYHMFTYSLYQRTSWLLEQTSNLVRRLSGREASLRVYNWGVDYGVVKYDDSGFVTENAVMSESL